MSASDNRYESGTSPRVEIKYYVLMVTFEGAVRATPEEICGLYRGAKSCTIDGRKILVNFENEDVATRQFLSNTEALEAMAGSKILLPHFVAAELI